MKVSELHRLNEGDTDLSQIDQSTYDSIKHEIEELAKDDEKEWPNALALVHDAYQIANVERPTPAMHDAWAQYETLISLAVQYLGKYQPDGNWRMTTASSDIKV